MPQFALSEATHLGRFVDAHGDQAAAEEDTLQVSGSVTDLEDALSLDEGQHTHNPILPAIEGNGRRDEVVRERKLVVKQTEEKSQKRLHKRMLWIREAALGAKK